MFKKNTEDFICDKCGTSVKGDGYTNHCPACLWSKHVDVEPGDRAADCCGLMKPYSVNQEGKEYILTHRCEVCGHEKRNRAHANDDFDALVEISKNKN